MFVAFFRLFPNHAESRLRVEVFRFERFAQVFREADPFVRHVLHPTDAGSVCLFVASDGQNQQSVFALFQSFDFHFPALRVIDPFQSLYDVAVLVGHAELHPVVGVRFLCRGPGLLPVVIPVASQSDDGTPCSGCGTFRPFLLLAGNKGQTT